jgi:hypothetical protein
MVSCFNLNLNSLSGKGGASGRIELFVAILQHLNAVSILYEELDAVALTLEEDEYFLRELFVAQFVPHDDAESVIALTHVIRSCGLAELDDVGRIIVGRGGLDECAG